MSTAEQNATSTRPPGRIRPARPRRVLIVPNPIIPPRELSNTPKQETHRPWSTNTIKRRTERHTAQELTPSPPPPPPPIQKPQDDPPAPPIWAPDRPTTHVKAHYTAQQDLNWHWESLPPTIAQTAQANHFFTTYGKTAKLLRSIPLFRLTPESDVPEIAFVGRSNVGKSSLLNAIVNADIKALLARTSATPGFTKTMNMYGLGPHGGVTLKSKAGQREKITGLGGLTIVDMPGYGQGSLASWGAEIMKYIQSRKQLRRVFVLLDAQHGIKDKDRSLLASLRLAGVSHQVILSKVDKIFLPPARVIKHFNGKELSSLRPKGTREGLMQEMQKLKAEIQPPVGGGALGEILACSAETLVDGKRLGIDQVRWAILKAAGLEGKVKGQKKVKGVVGMNVRTHFVE
ncbi:hypothetical protein P153DRAFT_422455 [Dothidotthia symphoricarpi CBS 119687]|uniref:EngB-type G domain-containing protein n=1 Tax=Dothidotthia symphoricarpi CBS 119687 TaxID=1392245 RepID=A0A6A6AH72_9PLEO|nr:uncharacterized protein P153DRAFT_422455 [Dothidotthia symphoricarpi CBS 119687]KAF2130593.1 hypothetical protein P153DRAFT_422455 [Dothidotthia symphoricarpi CBS 119687]